MRKTAPILPVVVFALAALTACKKESDTPPAQQSIRVELASDEAIRTLYSPSHRVSSDSTLPEPPKAATAAPTASATTALRKSF